MRQACRVEQNASIEGLDPLKTQDKDRPSSIRTHFSSQLLSTLEREVAIGGVVPNFTPVDNDIHIMEYFQDFGLSLLLQAAEPPHNRCKLSSQGIVFSRW